MPEKTIRGIKTKDGVFKLDYNSLINCPTLPEFNEDVFTKDENGKLNIDLSILKRQLSGEELTTAETAEKILNYLTEHDLQGIFVEDENGKKYLNVQALSSEINSTNFLNVGNKFIVDKDGNVTMSGKINFQASNMNLPPCQVLYSIEYRESPTGPLDDYKHYAQDDTTDWHTDFQPEDKWACYSYNNGETWTPPIRFGARGADGKTGQSAYEAAKAAGYQGSVDQWLDSLRGAQGESAYEAAKAAGYTGSIDQWLDSLRGQSAYELAQLNGYNGSKKEWLASLQGKSAYQIALETGQTTAQSEATWIAELRVLTKDQILDALSDGAQGLFIDDGAHVYINAEYLRASAANLTDVLAVGGTAKNPAFLVDDEGNVTMKGDIRLEGNITWGDNTNPSTIEVLYSNSTVRPTTPSSASDNAWHSTYNINDNWASYSYNAGRTWSAAIYMGPGPQGKQGPQGAPGEPGESAFEIAKRLDPTIANTEEEWLARLEINNQEAVLNYLMENNGGVQGIYRNPADNKIYIDTQFLRTKDSAVTDVLAVGKNDNNTYNFLVDKNGNVTMKGDINLEGDITWGTSNSPVKTQYSANGTSWHNELKSTDYYVRYSYDGGQTWTSSVRYRGEKGDKGDPGTPGAPGPAPTDSEIFNALTQFGKSQGIFVFNKDKDKDDDDEDDSQDKQIYINAQFIQSNTIGTNHISLGNSAQTGGFCWSQGCDTEGNTTYGATIHGAPIDGKNDIDDNMTENTTDPWEPRNTYHVMCTNRGIRITTPNYLNVDKKSTIGVFSRHISIDTETFSGTVAYGVTSDARAKNTITRDLSQYENFFYDLQPCSYKYNYGTSDRLHTGFIAQDVEQALIKNGLTTQDFAAYVHANATEDTEDEMSLRYSEFIALNTHMIQKLSKRIDELEAEIAELKSNQ